MDKDVRIRQRAHQIWEETDRPLGRDAEHWAKAQKEIEEELRRSTQSRSAGTNEVPETNVTVHRGPTSVNPAPGFESADGLCTPSVSSKSGDKG